MPEFILEIGSVEHQRTFNALDAFTQGYIEALFFTDEEQLCEESDDAREMPSVVINMATMESRFEVGNSFGFSDLAAETLESIIRDCEAFQRVNAALLDEAYAVEECDLVAGYSEESAGRDFWYTRNGHGVGFWDRGLGEVGEKLSNACGWKSRNGANPFPEVCSYVGDDGKVYLS